LVRDGAVVAGIAPPAGFKLARLDPALQSLDAGDLDLSQMALVAASRDCRIDDSLRGVCVGRGGAPVVKGLNLFAKLDTRPIKLDRLLGVQQLDLGARIPFPNPLDLVLTAGIRTRISLGKGAEFRELAFELRPSPRRFKLSLRGLMDLQVQRDRLQLTGEMALEPLTQTVSGTFVLDPRSGEWREPFGLRGVGVPKLALSLGATFGAGIPLPTLGLQAGLRIGAGRDPLRGEGVIVLNPRDPMNSMVALDVQQLSLMKILDFASPQASATVRGSPLARALADIMLQRASLRIVPNDIEFAGTRYERGYRVAGDFRVLGVNAKGLFELDYSRGVTALATMDPISLANGALRITGTRGCPAPVLELALRTDRQVMRVNGKLAVLRDMFVSETDLRIQPQAMELYARGKVFGALQAEVEMRAATSFRNPRADFYFRAKMEQTLLRELREKAVAEIDRATRKHVHEILEARRKVTAEKTKVDNFSRQIAATRKRVEARQARDIANMRKAAAASKAKATNEYNRLGALISKKKQQIKSNPLRGVDLGPEIAWLETRRNAEKLVLDHIGSNLVKGLADLGKNFPKELSSELGPMIAGQKIAQGALIAAQGVLDGYRAAVTGTMQAARWIADNGLGGVFDLNAMQLETALSSARGSTFAVALRGTFLKQPFTTELRLDLRSPDRIAKSISDALLGKNAPSRAFRPLRLQAQGCTPLAPPRSQPALSTADILRRCGAGASTQKAPPPPPIGRGDPRPVPGPEQRPAPRPSPRPAGKPAPAATPLSGKWIDSNRMHINLRVRGNQVTVQMVSTVGHKWWTHAAGAAQRGAIPSMVHYKGRTRVDTQRGSIRADGKRLDWGNKTHWVYVGPGAWRN
ncbi:MAG: hypothetical protein KDC87_16785, partial [Planctomycetes bacterium]|nr:hypothetical protein [Planctomycetota bacterium]